MAEPGSEFKVVKLCACGDPLHYSNEQTQHYVELMVALHGECVTITTPDGSWKVPRHFIALHGLKSKELPHLAAVLGFERAAA